MNDELILALLTKPASAIREMDNFHRTWEHVRENGSSSITDEFNMCVAEGVVATARTIRTGTSLIRELDVPGLDLKAAVAVTRQDPLQSVVYEKGSPQDINRLRHLLRLE